MIVLAASGCQEDTVQQQTFEPITSSEIPAEYDVVMLADGFRFTEGPVGDADGNVYFTDIPNNNIIKYSFDGKTSVFLPNSGGANGLYFDNDGLLNICQGGARQLSMLNAQGKLEVLADKYDDKPFNSPNDLWIDGKGGIYFTDPRYGNRDNMALGEHVYYLTPDRSKVILVIDDMARPNGLIGTKDGNILYVADNGGKKTFSYTINPDGTLSDKKLFVSRGSDGMTIDIYGNIYITTDKVEVYNSAAQEIMTIDVPQHPSNVTFAGKDNKTLYITARTAFYAVKPK